VFNDEFNVVVVVIFGFLFFVVGDGIRVVWEDFCWLGLEWVCGYFEMLCSSFSFWILFLQLPLEPKVEDWVVEAEEGHFLS
jgi:hypothetical protein